jgi:hypothetical protein
VENSYSKDLGNEYIDKGDGTIQDNFLGKIWTKTDSYNDLKRWINLKEASEHINEINRKKRGGFSDWRLPSREEIKTLFSQKHKGKKTFDKSETLWISEVFNFSYCYFWTNEKIDDEYVWQASLCNGKAYKTGKNNSPGNAAVLIRP